MSEPGDETVAVDKAALDAFIQYTDYLRMMVDADFCTNQAETDASAKDFDDRVAALSRTRQTT